MTPVVVAVLVATSGMSFAAAVHRSVRAKAFHDLIEEPPARPVGPGPSPRRLALVLGSVIGVVGAFLVVGPVGGAVAAGCAVVVPRTVERRRLEAGRSRLESQLAVSAASVAAALRAGQSLSQAIRFAAAEAEPPLSEALRAVVAREELGLPLEQSLARWEGAETSGDVRLVADVLRLRVGSGLPRVLDQVCAALRERETTRKEVRSLTAQARLSGTILGLLPIGFFAFLSVVSRGDMAAAYATPAGVASIVGGLVLDGLGFLWIRRLVAVRT